MRRVRLTATAALLLASLAGAGGASAPAATFCAHAPDGCTGTPEPTTQAALDAAAAAPGRDRVEVGDNTMIPEGFTIAAGNAVDVVGVGFATFQLGGTDTVTVAEPSALLTGIDFWAYPTTGVPIDLVAGTLQDSDVWITAMDPTIRLGDATLRRVSQPVGMDTGVGVDAVGPGGLIEDSQIVSETGIVSTSNGLVVRRTLVDGSGLDSGSTGLLVTAGTTTVEDTTLRLGAWRPGGVAVDVAPGSGTATLALRGVTIEGDREAPRLSSGLRATCAGAGTATVSLLDTAAWSSGLDLQQSGSGCAVALDHVRYGTREGAFADGPAVSAGPVGPMDVLLPGFGSSLVDAGSARPDDGGGDVNGNPRVVDGDGDGVAVRDIGAGEYQRRAPTAAVEGPSAARVGQAVRFDVGESDDADGLEAALLTFAWSVDGVPAPAEAGSRQGGAMDFTFSGAGRHAVDVVATDQSGLRATIGGKAVTLGSARFSVAHEHPKVIAVTVGAAGRSALRHHPKGVTVAVRVLKTSGKTWTNGKGGRVRPDTGRPAR
jgi:hypothetical protein